MADVRDRARDAGVSTLVVLVVISGLVAYVFFDLLGESSVAEVSSASVRAGGAFGGFLITFVSLARVLPRLQPRRPDAQPFDVTLKLRGRGPDGQFRKAGRYRVTYEVVRHADQTRDRKTLVPAIYPPYLEVQIPAVHWRDQIQVMVEDTEDDLVWETDSISVSRPERDAQRRLRADGGSQRGRDRIVHNPTPGTGGHMLLSRTGHRHGPAGPRSTARRRVPVRSVAGAPPWTTSATRQTSGAGRRGGGQTKEARST